MSRKTPARRAAWLSISVFSVPVISLLSIVLVAAQEAPVLVYRKIFKGSSPEYVELRISDRGCTYDIRGLADEPEPRPFEVYPATIQRMFALAAQLDNFRGAQLDVRKRIANLGEKTFRYEGGREVYETKFNYTTNPTAMELLMLFEGLSRQQDHLQTLAHRMRYDRLGVNQALLNFEMDLDRKVIPEPERLLPALEQLAADARYVDIARQRARMLIERIKASR
jgi:hypothetical protein